MAYEKKNGDTVLFRQTNKKNDKAPDFKGEILLDGQTLEIALWTKQGSKGEFYAGVTKPMDAKPAGSAYKKPAQSSNSFGDDIPFCPMV